MIARHCMSSCTTHSRGRLWPVTSEFLSDLNFRDNHFQYFFFISLACATRANACKNVLKLHAVRCNYQLWIVVDWSQGKRESPVRYTKAVPCTGFFFFFIIYSNPWTVFTTMYMFPNSITSTAFVCSLIVIIIRDEEGVLLYRRLGNNGCCNIVVLQ